MYDKLFGYPNVVGAGRGIKTSRGQKVGDSVIVLVERKLPRIALAPSQLVPTEYEGSPTDVIEVGRIVAPRPIQSQAVSRTDRIRPAPGGVSIGHYQITAGTLGCLVYNLSTGKLVLLSNNHVFANSNKAVIGDPILQPGTYDGGKNPEDHIANLMDFVPIVFSDEPGTCPIAELVAIGASLGAVMLGSSHRLYVRKESAATNKVDAAIALPLKDSDISPDILEIPGSVNGWNRVSLGDKVAKSGRTTGVTQGEVLVVGATIQVNYGGDKVATFEDQFITGPMSQGGDSGSLVVFAGDDIQTITAAGLLFAGSDQVTICNNIGNVLSELNIAFTL